MLTQSSSPFFKLPAEIRVAIYQLLDYPPVDNEQCRGLILSCRQAKDECDEVSFGKTKEWLATFKQTNLSESGIRFLLPLSKPIGSRFKLNTIRELTVVFPARMLYEFDIISRQFFLVLRQLNPIFGLWLDKLTLHFPAATADFTYLSGKDWIAQTFRRLFFVLRGAFTYAHDPVGQARMKEVQKYSSMWDIWKPEPVFMRKIVISWAFTDEETRTKDTVAVEGTCKKRPTTECVGSRLYRVFSEDGLRGEFMIESSCRFRYSEKETRFARPSSEHKMNCFKCGMSSWDYGRYMRALPEDDNDRWI